MDKPVGVGLVGAGAFGQFCLDAFAAMPDVRIVGVADVDLARARDSAARHHAQAYTQLEEMLQNPDVEIVALNTPPHLHGEQGLAVLHAGKHLFCEKPLALTLEAGQQLIQTAEEKGLRLTVDYVMRQNLFWAAAAAIRESGLLGQLRHMDLANHAAGLELSDSHWFWDRSKSGGIWIEHGVHFFDAFAWVSGETGEILSSVSYTRGDGVIDRVEALARYGESAAHFYHAFDQSGKTEQTTVMLTFEKGYITLREWVPTSLEILTTVPADDIKPLLPGTIMQHQRADGRTHLIAEAKEGKSAIYRQSIQAGLRDLAFAVRNPAYALKVTGEHGLNSLRLAVNASV